MTRGYLWSSLSDEIADEFSALAGAGARDREAIGYELHRDRYLRQSRDWLRADHYETAERYRAIEVPGARTNWGAVLLRQVPGLVPRPRVRCRRGHDVTDPANQMHLRGGGVRCRACHNGCERRRARAMRIKLPDERDGCTFRFRIISPSEDDSNALEEVKGYVTASVYPPTMEVSEGEGDAKRTVVVPHPRAGKVAEVFVKIGKPGHQTAILDDWAQEFSRALQSADDPLPLLRRHRHKQYLPAGAVVGVQGITRCTSIVDLVCHILQRRFCKVTDEQLAAQNG